MEPFIEVDKYFARWDLDNHTGRIVLYSEKDGKIEELDNRVYPNLAEYQLILEMLRLEKPLYFDDRTKHLRTGFGADGEPVGEGEGG